MKANVFKAFLFVGFFPTYKFLVAFSCIWLFFVATLVQIRVQKIMASSYLFLDTRSDNKEGTYPLKIIIKHGTKVSIHLKIYLTKEQWSDGVVVNHPKKSVFNQIIKFKTSEINSLLFRLHNEGKLQSMTAKQVKTLVNRTEGKEAEAQEAPSEKEYKFMQGVERKLSKLTNERTKEIYRSTLDKVNIFSSVEALTFAQISYDWLHDFEQHLKLSVEKINARAVHLRNIRAVFNDAIDEGKVSLDRYPFRRFKIKKQQTIKRSLTVEQLRQIRDTHWTPKVQEAADFFMLSFYLIGMNIIDILHLKELNGDKVAYYRAKTGRLYEFNVPPEAIPIFEKYRGSEYLLLWRERYTDYRGFTGIVNERCKEIGKVIGAPTLTTYAARHTWATIAASLDIPKETIAAALGHAERSVTDVYINFDHRKIDKANQRVIAHLFEA